MERSKKAIARAAKRDGEQIKKFKSDIEDFFKRTDISEEAKYKIMVDLSTMTWMPFYHQDKGKRYKCAPTEVIRECCRCLINYENIDFAKTLLQSLTRQQNQSLRKISKRSTVQKCRAMQIPVVIWEHPVPLRVSVNTLLRYIEEKNLDNITRYLNYISKIPQIAISKEDNDKLKIDSMPDGWEWDKWTRWDDKTNSPFARYFAAGFDLKELGIKEEDYSDIMIANTIH